MFDVGILELFIVGVIALLVLGPERLPKAAQQAGRWIGHAKRAASRWSDEINRQIENEELSKELKRSGALEGLNEKLEPINKAFSQSLSGHTLGAGSQEAVATPIHAKVSTKGIAKNDVSVQQDSKSDSSLSDQQLSASA